MKTDGIEAQLQIIGSKIEKLNLQNTFVLMELSDESIKREMDVSYEVSDPFILGESKDVLAANVMLHIMLGITNEDFETSIELDIEGCFILKGSTDEDLLREMLPVNGCAALYSIARGIIASVTSNMCVNGTILIPMINVFKLVNGDKKQEDADKAE